MSAPVAERGSARRLGGGIGRAALLIGAITMLARVIGFGRQVVFAHTVQASCVGTAYTTANMVPNIIYDIVMGGALTAVVVPVLAGPVLASTGMAAAGDMSADREQVRQTSAALLSWTVLLLVPVSLVVAVIARPLVSLLLGGTPGCPRADMVTLGTRMLVIFAPQILLYGLAVVLYGILQAHRRFVAPALAPVLSSLIVIGAYFWFGVAGSGYQDLCPAGARPSLDRAGRRDHRRGGGAGRHPVSSPSPGCACGCGRGCASRLGSACGSARWPRLASPR